MTDLPAGVCEVSVVSSLDGSPEKNLFFVPDERRRVPLVVGLHTWSCDRYNQLEAMLPLCRQRGWALLLPEFRGPNRNTNPRARQACASRLARQDIVDAVEWVCSRYAVDDRRVFLLGGSGGGHMALMMAAYAPQAWCAVSAWVPITDLAAWHAQNSTYAPHIEACCGGAPGASPEVDREYAERSPMSHIPRIAAATVSVHHGRYDRSVPYTHTWNLAQALERQSAERFYVEVFDGGHEIRHQKAFGWFALCAGERTSARPLTG